METTELRLDELEPLLWRLLRLYQLHVDVFTKDNDQRWNLFTGVARDVTTDPLFVFSYYDRKQRTASASAGAVGQQKGRKSRAKQPAARQGRGIIPFDEAERYWAIYTALRRDDMNLIERLVHAYARFYRADREHLDSSYIVTRPLSTAINLTKNSDTAIERDHLILHLAGAIHDEVRRVRSDPATPGGLDPIAPDRDKEPSPEQLARSQQAIEDFARLFVADCFEGYCKGDRGILRERANTLRSAANFYYLITYGRPDAAAKTEPTGPEPAA
jgi:CRISPR-associated protein Csc3